MKKIVLLLFLGCAATLTSSSSFGFREWDTINSPNQPGRVFLTNFQILKSSGSVAQIPWSDYYWPHQKGGIAFRWQGSTGVLLNHNQLNRASEAQLNALSPAEKYDLLMQQYDFPIARKQREQARHATASWAGYCQGVAVAATNFLEPETLSREIQLPNGSLKTITFYSSDIKALLALASSQSSGHFNRYGMRCDNSKLSESGACWDTNPATFYIALTNWVGNAKKPLLLDVDPTIEVWNAAIISYRAKLSKITGISSQSADGTARRVRVDLSVEHTLGTKPSRERVGTKRKTTQYAFTLELDKNENIIGGEWISSNRPDFVWIASNAKLTPGYFGKLTDMIVFNESRVGR